MDCVKKNLRFKSSDKNGIGFLSVCRDSQNEGSKKALIVKLQKSIPESSFLLHIGRQWRGASKFRGSAKSLWRLESTI